MLLIGVQFNGNNRIYYYKSPYALHIGQQVTVNVAGESKVVKVVDNDVDEDEMSFSGSLKTIEGIVYRLEDLEQPELQEKPSLFQTIARHFAG